jgi:hypothetical protein
MCAKNKKGSVKFGGLETHGMAKEAKQVNQALGSCFTVDKGIANRAR